LFLLPCFSDFVFKIRFMLFKLYKKENLFAKVNLFILSVKDKQFLGLHLIVLKIILLKNQISLAYG